MFVRQVCKEDFNLICCNLFFICGGELQIIKFLWGKFLKSTFLFPKISLQPTAMRLIFFHMHPMNRWYKY